MERCARHTQCLPVLLKWVKVVNVNKVMDPKWARGAGVDNGGRGAKLPYILWHGLTLDTHRHQTSEMKLPHG